MSLSMNSSICLSRSCPAIAEVSPVLPEIRDVPIFSSTFSFLTFVMSSMRYLYTVSILSQLRDLCRYSKGKLQETAGETDCRAEICRILLRFPVLRSTLPKIRIWHVVGLFAL